MLCVWYCIAEESIVLPPPILATPKFISLDTKQTAFTFRRVTFSLEQISCSEVPGNPPLHAV